MMQADHFSFPQKKGWAWITSQALAFRVPKLDGMMSSKIWSLPLPYITWGSLGGINWGYGMVVGPI